MEGVKKNFSSAQSLSPLIAGISGGAVSTALLLPLDVIKVRLQVAEAPRRKMTMAEIGGPNTTPVKPQKRLNAFRVVNSIFRHEGMAGFYQGLTPALIGSSVSWGGYFFLYEGFKKSLRDFRASKGMPEQLTSLDNFSVACFSGGCMVFLTNPVWLIKTRMQLQMKNAAESFGMKAPYKSMADAAKTIVREEGFWALYKGTGPALLLTSHGGVQFVVYEFLKRHFHYVRPKRDASKSVLERLELSIGFLTIGAISKIAASTATYPLQVLKARLQQRADSVEITADGDLRAVRREYHGIIKSVRRMWRREGLAGFFRGCIPNAIRVAPGAAITFVVYETVLDLLS